MSEGYPVPQAQLALQFQCRWPEETLESLEGVAFPVSPDPEVYIGFIHPHETRKTQEKKKLSLFSTKVTKVFQARLVVRVCLDFQVLLNRAKGCRDSLVSPGSRDIRAALARKVKAESWDSLAQPDQG